MKFRKSTVLLILLLMFPLFLNCGLTTRAVATETSPSLYFGVDVAFGSIAATDQLIDSVSSYTNFFVIGCSQNYNETRLTIVSQYVYSKGLAFIVYTDDTRYPSRQWLETAQNMWGNRFMGIYFYDEPGGRQLDQATLTVPAADNYSDAASKYVSSFNWWLRSGSNSITKSFAYPTEYQLFTSDYAFYWYDYQAGYDAIFAEFGDRIGNWNNSRQLNVALCRGAASAMGKDWGIMITWTYTKPPYIESGPELYNDMVLAYQNGAKYILIFDSNQDYSGSILHNEQTDAMKQFWQYIKDNPRSISPAKDRTAYVLPEDYAYGFRGPNDRVWGLWGPDALTNDICLNASMLMQECNINLDIIYPDGPQSIQSIGYKNVVYWNNTPIADNSASPSPFATDDPKSSSSPQKGIFLPQNYLLAAATGVIVIIIASIIILKIKKTNKPATDFG